DGMMADAISQAASCGFRVFYWAHDEDLWDGTLPFSQYWASYESQPGVFSGSYVESIRALLKHLRQAGMKVILGLGL
ncbi:MAG: hypothetical protein ACLQVK_12950, partial [Acidimicrobiales bacterium]